MWERYTGNMGETQLENLDSENIRDRNVGIGGIVYQPWIAKWNFIVSYGVGRDRIGYSRFCN